MNKRQSDYFKIAPVSLMSMVFVLFFGQAVQARTTSITPPNVPDNLKAPAGELSVLKFMAKGVQIYTCTASTTNTTGYEWVLKAPQAELFNEQGTKVGKHYAGPTWEAADGSKVVGEVKEKADSPDGKGIPWLLLKTKETSGNGSLSKINYIQRVETVAGFSPNSADCNEARKDSEVKVEYSATYYFYSAAGVANSAPAGVPATGQGGTMKVSNLNDFSLVIVLGLVLISSLTWLLIGITSHDGIPAFLNSSGVFGYGNYDIGVFGKSINSFGVMGESTDSAGILGSSTNVVGVLGQGGS